MVVDGAGRARTEAAMRLARLGVALAVLALFLAFVALVVATR